MSTAGSTRKNHRQCLALATIGVLALTSACGTNVSHSRIAAVGNGYNATVPSSTNNGLSGSSADGTTGATTGGVTGATSPGTTGATTGGTTGATSPGTTGATTGGTTGATTPGTTGGTTGATTGGTTGTGSAAPCAKTLSPVVIGQTLSSSGLVGAAIGNLRTGLAIWAKDVNARGGVQCHPVKLYQADDASDPSKVSSNWNDLIHNKGAVAMVGAGVPIAIAALRSAAERDKVPVVGGDSVPVDWVQSPYLFPQGGSPLTAYDGAVVEAARATPGAKKTGLLYCVEASICTAFAKNFPNSAKKAGLAVGPVKAVSLTQSDFTAECQAEKDAGVQVLYLAVDGSASTRVARSCASLGYHPTIATAAIAVSAQAANDPNLRANRTFLGAPVVPFTEAGTPGGQAFHAAVKRYGSGTALDEPTMLGWSAGKLFEAALAKVAAQARAGNVTTQMVLDGLWQLKNETLQGLSPGATFTKGAAASAKNCYYAIRIDTSGYSAPNKSAMKCI